ncbi:MAG TPA: hypothetical protein VHO49_04650 [Anaerolineales bacterium]|nr:hypothetical protein [Anaerolineales bacterium]
MEQVWQFAGSSKEGEPFEIRGVNVWEQGWQVSAGHEAHVKDPVYGQAFVFRVYTIQDGEEKVEFAAGEFSNGVWGFFTRN